MQTSIETSSSGCCDVPSARHAVQVLERAKQYRPMGAGIGIDVNGMKAIEAIDPSLRKWFNAEGLSLSSSVINDHKGVPPALPPCLPGPCMYVLEDALSALHKTQHAILAAIAHVSADLRLQMLQRAMSVR